MPRILGLRAEDFVQVSLEAGTKKSIPRDPFDAFDFPIIYMQAYVQRALTEVRVLAESSRQYMVDRIYAGAGDRVVAKPVFPPAKPNANAKPFELERVTDHYWKWKALRGLDLRTLIAIGDYTHHLEVKKTKETKDGVSYVMTISAQKQHIGARFVKKGKRRPTYRQLARWLEFGTENPPGAADAEGKPRARWRMVPRPHWRPAAQEMARRFKRAPKKVGASALRDFLRKARG